MGPKPRTSASGRGNYSAHGTETTSGLGSSVYGQSGHAQTSASTASSATQGRGKARHRTATATVATTAHRSTGHEDAYIGASNDAIAHDYASKSDPKSHLNARLDFSALPASTLRRYQRVHKLHYTKVRGGHREDLASAVAKHFNNQPVNEPEAISWFIYAARSRDNVLKLTQKPPI